jgi:DNA-directed RNA polymerase specialized sigma24 family protein
VEFGLDRYRWYARCGQRIDGPGSEHADVAASCHRRANTLRCSERAPAKPGEHLTGLLCRTAAGDRPAFRCLFGGLVLTVWHVVAGILPDPHLVPPVVEATFLEVRHRAAAFDPRSDDARAWVLVIAASRAEDRLRSALAAGHNAMTDAITAAYDAHRRLELAARLGRESIVVRVGPSRFVRVPDLAQAAAVLDKAELDKAEIEDVPPDGLSGHAGEGRWRGPPRPSGG